MRLRNKALMTLGVILVGLLAVLYAASALILRHSFIALEEQYTRRDLQRIEDALAQQRNALSMLTFDWAVWDDTYTFIADHNPDYVNSNLVESLSENLGLSLILFVDLDGEVVYLRHYDREEGVFLPTPDDWIAALLAHEQLFAVEEAIDDLLRLPHGLIVVSAHPILTSEEAGPARGTLVMGRYMDALALAQLSELTHLSLALYTEPPEALQAQYAEIIATGERQIVPLDRDTVAGYTLLEDVEGQPLALLEIESPRDIFAQGRLTTYAFTVALLAAGVLFGALALWLLQHGLLTRLARMGQEVAALGQQGDLNARVSVEGHDDLAVLAGDLNQMLTRLEAAQHQLQESEARYRRLVDFSPELILVVQDSRVRFVNPAGARLLGEDEPRQLVGRAIAEFVPFEYWEQVKTSLHTVTSDGRELPLAEGRFLQADGEYVYLETVVLPFNYEGQPAVQIIGRDITARKQAEAALRAQKQLFENLVAVARATTTNLSMEETLRNTVDLMLRLTDAQSGSLFLLDEDCGVPYGKLARGDVGAAELRQVAGQVLDEGLAGWVVREGKSVLVPDVNQDPRWLALPGQPYEVASALLVPIMRGGEALGVLTLMHAERAHFTEAHRELLEVAADQVALGLQNAAFYEVQHQFAKRQTILYEVLRTVGGHTNPEAVVHVAVEKITHLTGWHAIGILLPDQTGEILRIEAAGGELTPPSALMIPIGQGIVGRAFAEARTYYLPDVQEDPNYIAGRTETRSELAVPLRRGPRVLGVLNIESRDPQAFVPADRQLAESLAEAIALALDMAHSLTEIRQYAANLNVLYALNRTINNTLRLEEMLSRTLYSALNSLGFESGVIYLTDPLDRHLYLATSWGLPAELEAELQVADAEQSLGAYIQRRHQPLWIDDLQNPPPFLQKLHEQIPAGIASIERAGIRCCVGTPLLQQANSLGALCLFTRQPLHVSADTPSLLMAVGQQLATGVINTRLFRAIADERSRLQALIESSRDGLLLISMERRILVINAQALELLRLSGTPEGWIGSNVLDLLLALRHTARGAVYTLSQELRRILQGDEPVAEGEIEVRSRTLRWLDIPVKDGEQAALGRLLVLRDVTEARFLEKMREDLTHTMVHDLRNPLTGISGALKLLRKGLGDVLKPELTPIMSIAESSTQRMLGLVNSILDISKLESGQMPLQREALSLQALIESVIATQLPLAVTGRLMLDYELPDALPLVWVDATLVERVLQNLVGNAIKFTPEGGVVQISAVLDAADGEHVRVSVNDTGLGIPYELQDKLFQKFTTGLQQGSGSGLGLVFCKMAIEAHGERIWLESQPGNGATFTFTLPTVVSD